MNKTELIAAVAKKADLSKKDYTKDDILRLMDLIVEYYSR